MEDLRNSIQGWSLESDDRLLRALSTFSNKIVERTKQVNDDLETLGEQTRATQSQLQNTFNRFLMLQSGQFIENRVVRDQQTAKKIHEEKQQQQQESQMNGNETQTNAMQSATQIIETYKRALNLGMVAMEHTVPQSVLASALQSQQDSIEAGIPPSLPKCHKDAYNNQPLPYIIGTPEFSKNEDLGLFGAFNDNVFYNIIEEESDEQDDDSQESGSSEAEDFDFTWMKPYASTLVPQLADYYEPNHTTFYRDDVRNFFPDAEEEQIDDIFEYFEDDNGYDTAEQSGSEWINVTQMLQLLQECDKEWNDGADDHVIKKKKGARVAVGLAAALKDELSSEDEDMNARAGKEHKKKKRKNSDKKPSAAIFAAIDDFDTSSEEDGGGIGTGFFISDKKTDIKDFGLSDDDSEDDFGITAALTGDPHQKKKKKEENDVDKSKKKSDPFADSDGEEAAADTKVKKDPFGDSSDDEFMDITSVKASVKKDMFDDSDDESDGGFKIDPTKLLPQRKVQPATKKAMDMFDDSDDDAFEDTMTQPTKAKVQTAPSDMFGDSDEDDDPLFGAMKSKAEPKPSAQKAVSKFDFEDSDEDPLFSIAKAKPNKPKAKSDIFDHSDDEDEDEGEMSSVGIKIDVHKLHMGQQGMTVAQIKARKHGKRSDPLGGMFGDSDEDDNDGLDITSTAKSDIFGDTDEEEEEEDKGEMSSVGIKIDVHKLNMGPGMTVAQIKALKHGSPVEKPKKSPKRSDPLSGMFGDSEEDDNEDFDVKPKRTPKKRAKAEDAEDAEDDPPSAAVDAPKKKEISSAKADPLSGMFEDDKAKKKPVRTSKPKSDIFGDSDDDDEEEDEGEMSSVGIKIDVHKLNMGPGMTVAQIKSLKAGHKGTNRSDPLDIKPPDATAKKEAAPLQTKQDADLFSTEPLSRIEDAKAEGDKSEKKTKVSSFFDDDADDLSDLFSSKPKKKKKKSGVKSLFDDDDDDDDFFISKKPKKKGKKGKKGKKKKAKSLFDLNSDDEDAFDKQHQPQPQPQPQPQQKVVEEPKEDTQPKIIMETEPQPEPHTVIAVEEAKGAEPNASKKKHKMNAKLAAKFGHLHFDPTKMKVGASPPKRKQVKQEMDQTIVLNKATVSKRGRRKRTKKKLNIDADEKQKETGVSASLFSSETITNEARNHKQEIIKVAFNPLDDAQDQTFEAKQEVHETQNEEEEVKPQRTPTQVFESKPSTDRFGDSEEEEEDKATPVTQRMFDDEHEVKAQQLPKTTAKSNMFGDSEDEEIEPKTKQKEEKPLEPLQVDTTPEPPQTEPNPKPMDKTQNEKDSNQAETTWKLDLDLDQKEPKPKPKRMLATSRAEDELDALFGNESKVEPKSAKEPTPSPPVQREQMKEAQIEKEPKNIFDDSDSDDMFSPNKTFKTSLLSVYWFLTVMEFQTQRIPSLDELLNVYDFHNAMKRKLLHSKSGPMDDATKRDQNAYNFYMTGVLDEYTLRENERIYSSIWLRPRISFRVKDKRFINTNIALFGGKTKCALPIYVSATSRSSLAHKQGEIEILSAAHNKDVIYMIPAHSSISFEELIKTKKDDQTLWYQFYTMNAKNDPHKQYVKKKLDLAISNGIKTIVMTVDSPSYAKRERYLKVNDNYWMSNQHPTVLNPSQNWSFVDWIVENYCKKYDIQLILKGVGSGEDVLRAYHLDYVVGVILSNHGGRQGEYFRSSIEVLMETMALFNQNNINVHNENGFEIFVDGGIRRGTDIFKALCLGASAVGIGRAVIYGLACYGQNGVEKIIEIFRDELVSCMQCMGVDNIKQMKRNMVCYKRGTFHSGLVPTNQSRYHTYSRSPKL